MTDPSAADAGLIGAIAAGITGIGLVIRQLTAGRAEVAQVEANRQLYDMLTEQIERLHSENRQLREDDEIFISYLVKYNPINREKSLCH